MKKQLVTRLVRLIASVLIVFSLIVGLLFSVVFTKQTEDLHVEELTRRSELIRDTLEEYFVENQVTPSSGNGNRHNGMMGYGAFLRFLNQIAGDTVWVVDESLTPVIGMHHLEETQPLPKAAQTGVAEVYQTQQTAIQKESSFLQVSKMVLYEPVMVNQQLIGVLIFQSDVAAVHKNQANGYLILILSLLIALVIGILVAIKLAKSFVQPIKEMANYTTALSEEVYLAPLEIDTDDELSELAERLSQLSQRLKAAQIARENKEKSEKEFLSQISHELRTPVMAIKGSLEALSDGLVVENQRMDYYQELLQEATALERLINDLLELSRLQSTEFSLEQRKIDLMEVLADAQRSYRLPLKQKQQQVILTNHGDSVIFILGDYGRLVQLFANLLDNAHKYSQVGSHIYLEITETSKEVQVAMRNPTTIPLAETGLFTAFQRGAAPQRVEGTGLGLAIAQQIVQRHQGHVEIKQQGDLVEVVVVLPIWQEK